MKWSVYTINMSVCNGMVCVTYYLQFLRFFFDESNLKGWIYDEVSTFTLYCYITVIVDYVFLPSIDVRTRLGVQRFWNAKILLCVNIVQIKCYSRYVSHFKFVKAAYVAGFGIIIIMVLC